MIQDIAPEIMDQRYRDEEPSAGDRVLAFDGEMLSVVCEEPLTLPRYEDIGGDPALYRYLFAISGQKYFLYLSGAPKDLPQVRARFHLLPENGSLSLAISTGYHLAMWYRGNRFCGCCGGKLVHAPKMRMLQCEGCGNMLFPRIAPAVIIAVTDGDKLLLTRYRGRAYTGYALLAGFIEIGETPEQTVEREVMEEVGLKVKNIRFCGTQPWGIDGDLLLGYFCDVDGDPTIVLDEEELKVGGWVARDDVPEPVNMLSLTMDMIERFRTGDVPE